MNDIGLTEDTIESESVAYSSGVVENTPTTVQEQQPRAKGKRKEQARKWTDEETEKLISLWCERELLFDTNNPNYFNNTERDKCISQISNAFPSGVTKKDILAKMDNLRSYYSKLRGMVVASKKSGAGADEVYSPKWTWYQQLSFLNDHLTPRKTQSNIKPRKLSFCLSDGDNEELATTAGPIYSGCQPSSKSVKKMKLAKEDELIDSALQVMKKSDNPKNVDMLWGEQIGHLIQTIPTEETKEMLKLEIQRMIFNARFQKNTIHSQRQLHHIPGLPNDTQVYWDHHVYPSSAGFNPTIYANINQGSEPTMNNK